MTKSFEVLLYQRFEYVPTTCTCR